MSDKFDSLPWHDAELLEITVDRRRPGEKDEVLLRVNFKEMGESTLFFGECYGLSAQCNFGISAEERILSGGISSDDAGLLVLREKWRSLGVELGAVKCYRIETSSTGSVIRIFAKRFSVS